MFIVIRTGQEDFKAIHTHLNERHEHSDTNVSPTEISQESDGGSLGTHPFCEVPDLLTFSPANTTMEALLCLIVGSRTRDGC